MSKSSEEKLVSEFYHSIKTDDESLVPPSNIDATILEAAAASVVTRKRNKYLLPFSAAASVLIVVSVAFQLSLITDRNSSEYNNESIRKQPMYMLQRSKPASANEMEILVVELVEKGEIEQARQLYKRITVRYPSHTISADLNNRLK